MAKKKNKEKSKEKKTKVPKSLLRKKDAMTKWVQYGRTLDGGCGSHVSKLIRDNTDTDLSSLNEVYQSVIELVSSLSDAEQRLVCMAVASDYSLKSLILKAAEVKSNLPKLKLTKSEENMIKAVKRRDGEDIAVKLEKNIMEAKELSRNYGFKSRGNKTVKDDDDDDDDDDETEDTDLEDEFDESIADDDDDDDDDA